MPNPIFLQRVLLLGNKLAPIPVSRIVAALLMESEGRFLLESDRIVCLESSILFKYKILTETRTGILLESGKTLLMG